MSDDLSNHKSRQKSWRPATQLVRGGIRRSPFDETSEGLFMTSGYVYGSAEEAEQSFKGERQRYMYSRYANPTVNMFEDRLALLEGAEYCVATATGMAAVFASLACMLKAGDRVVAARALFGSCLYIIDELFPALGIETELVDGTELGQWEQALAKGSRAKGTQAVFLETPSNPTLEIIDLKAVSELAHRAGARVVIDNVFATPVLQRPLELGADIVVYSATKHIDGQGRVMGGAILTDDGEYIEDRLTPFFRHTGPSMSPFNAWVLLKGLETIGLRVERHSANAAAVATALEGVKKVGRVLYPGLASHPQHTLALSQMSDGGTMVAFEIQGSKEGAFRFLDALDLIDISNNLGDAKSLITHPATTTHQRIGAEARGRLGIGDGLVRLSVGLEDPADIIDDLTRALAAV